MLSPLDSRVERAYIELGKTPASGGFEGTMSNPQFDGGVHEDAFAEDEVKEPRRFRVLLHNDDYTTMEFVIQVLVGVFRKSESEAARIMLMVHNEGMGVCGVYPAEVAETKVAMVRQMAREAGYPLRCSMEEE